MHNGNYVRGIFFNRSRPAFLAKIVKNTARILFTEPHQGKIKLCQGKEKYPVSLSTKKIATQKHHIGSYNIFRPAIPFLGIVQTVQTQFRRRKRRRLNRAYTVCLLAFLWTIQQK